MKNISAIHISMPIKIPRLLIRNPLPGDHVELNQSICESFEELTKWMPWAEKKPSLEDSRGVVNELYSQFLIRTDMTLFIFDPQNKRHLGGTGLHRIHWNIPSFEIGYWCRSSETGKGYITEAVNALTRYAFHELGAKRIHIRCDADNTKSAQVAKRLGFEYEGRLRHNSLKCHGQGLCDTLVFSRID